MQSFPRTYLPLITFVALPNCHWVVSIHLPWSWSYQCAPITLQWLYTPPPFAYRQVATNHFFNENTLRPRGSSSNPRPIGFYQQHNFTLLTYRTLISSGCFDQPSFGLWARRASSAPRWWVSCAEDWTRVSALKGPYPNRWTTQDGLSLGSFDLPPPARIRPDMLPLHYNDSFFPLHNTPS